MIKVLLVDDHELIRIGIHRLLADQPDIEVAGSVKTGEEAIHFVRENPVEVILMDVKMPGIGGLEATKKILHYHPEMKIIALTVCEEEPFPSKLLQAGAYGFLSKGTGLHEMVDAIHSVYAGKKYLGPDIAQTLALKTMQDEKENPFEQLSDRELQVLMLILSGKKTQAISEKLCLSPKTVNTYRYRILDKIKVTTDVELARVAMRYGIIKAEASDI